MSELRQLLANVQSTNDEVRQRTEKQLEQAEQSQFNQFCVELTKELAATDEGRNDYVQQTAGLILKACISGPPGAVDAVKRANWMNRLAAPERLGMKTTLLWIIAAPGVPEPVKLVSGQIIAKIARLEIPSRSWPELFEQLGAAMTSEDTGVKVAACHTLGFIADDAEVLETETNTDVLDMESKQQLLSLLFGHGIPDPEPLVKLAALKATYHAMVYAGQFINDQFTKDQIFRTLGNCMNLTGSPLHYRIVMAAWEVFLQISNYFYRYLPDYIEDLLKKSLAQLQTPAPNTPPELLQHYEDLGAITIEFWNTICDEELSCQLEAARGGTNDSHNFISKYGLTLLPALFECTAYCAEDADADDEGDVDEEWTLNKAAASCVGLCAQLLGDAIVDPAIAFISANSTSTQWARRDASLIVYGSIMRGAPSERVAPLFKESFPALCDILEKDPHSAVRDSAAWCFGRAAKFHINAIEAQVLKLVSLLLSRIQDKPRVAQSACYALHEILSRAQELPPATKQTLNSWFTQIADWLVAAAKREEGSQWRLRQAAYQALDSLVLQAPTDNPQSMAAVQILLNELLTWLEATTQVPYTDEVGYSQEPLLNCMTALLSTLLAAEKAQPVEFQERLYKAFVYCLTAGVRNQPTAPHIIESWGPATTESMYALIALMRAARDNGYNFLPSLVPIIKRALRQYDEPKVASLAAEVVAMMVIMREHFKPFLTDICQDLFSVLQDKEAPTELKPKILSALGDIALFTGAEFAPVLPSLLQALREAARAQPGTDDEEWVSYINTLRDGTLTAYSSAISCAEDCTEVQDAGNTTSSGLRVLAREVSGIMSFVMTVIREPKSTASNVEKAIIVLEDLVKAYTNMLATQIHNAGFATAIMECRHYRESPVVHEEAARLEELLTTYRV